MSACNIQAIRQSGLSAYDTVWLKISIHLQQRAPRFYQTAAAPQDTAAAAHGASPMAGPYAPTSDGHGPTTAPDDRLRHEFLPKT